MKGPIIGLMQESPGSTEKPGSKELKATHLSDDAHEVRSSARQMHMTV
jgi:hypothetical protein